MSGLTAAERYKSLIQPLKDLALSFDVDISDCLGDYLDALLELSLSDTNFVEAALVIQGSTLVFGKKVDFLLQLVHETLDSLTAYQPHDGELKNKGNSTAARISSSREEEAMYLSFEPSLLVLDEVIAERCIKNNTKIVKYQGATRTTRFPSRNKARAVSQMARVSFGANASLSSINASRNSLLVMQTVVEQTSGRSGVKLCSSAVDAASGALIIMPFDLAGGSSRNCSVRMSLSTFSHKGKANEISAAHASEIYSAPAVEAAADEDSNNHMEPSCEDRVEEGLSGNKSLMNLTVSPIKARLSYEPDQLEAKKMVRKALLKSDPMAMLDPHCKHGISKPLRVGRSSALPKKKGAKEAKSEEGDADSVFFSPTELFYPNAFGNFIKSKLKPNPLPLQPQAALGSALEPFDDNGDDEYAVFRPDSFLEQEDGSNPIGSKTFAGQYFDPEDGDDFGAPNESEVGKCPGGSRADEMDGYEDICRAHLATFMRDAEAFSRDSQISIRVAAWSRRLEPILLKEETAPPFDIHRYCQHTTHLIAEETKKAKLYGIKKSGDPSGVEFDDIVRGCDRAEVGRIFLSCLQLINAGGVDVNVVPRGSDNILKLDEKYSGGKISVRDGLPHMFLKALPRSE